MSPKTLSNSAHPYFTFHSSSVTILPLLHTVLTILPLRQSLMFVTLSSFISIRTYNPTAASCSDPAAPCHRSALSICLSAVFGAGAATPILDGEVMHVFVEAPTDVTQGALRHHGPNVLWRPPPGHTTGVL
jgi:hypothetical protein